MSQYDIAATAGISSALRDLTEFNHYYGSPINEELLKSQEMTDYFNRPFLQDSDSDATLEKMVAVSAVKMVRDNPFMPRRMSQSFARQAVDAVRYIKIINNYNAEQAEYLLRSNEYLSALSQTRVAVRVQNSGFLKNKLISVVKEKILGPVKEKGKVLIGKLVYRIPFVGKAKRIFDIGKTIYNVVVPAPVREKIKEKTTEFVSRAKERLSNGVKKLAEAGRAVARRVVEKVQTVATKIKENVVEPVKTAIKSGWNKLKEGVKSVGKKVWNFLFG